MIVLISIMNRVQFPKKVPRTYERAPPPTSRYFPKKEIIIRLRGGLGAEQRTDSISYRPTKRIGRPIDGSLTPGYSAPQPPEVVAQPGAKVDGGRSPAGGLTQPDSWQLGAGSPPRAAVAGVGTACGDPCWRSDSPFDVSTDRCRRLDRPSQATRSFVGGPITRDPHGGDVRRPPSRGDSSGDVPYSSTVSDELRTSRVCVRHTRVTPKGWRQSSEAVKRYPGRESAIFLESPPPAREPRGDSQWDVVSTTRSPHSEASRVRTCSR